MVGALGDELATWCGSASLGRSYSPRLVGCYLVRCYPPRLDGARLDLLQSTQCNAGVRSVAGVGWVIVINLPPITTTPTHVSVPTVKVHRGAVGSTTGSHTLF